MTDIWSYRDTARRQASDLIGFQVVATHGVDGLFMCTLMAGVTGALAAYVFFALPTQGMEFAYMGFTPKLMAINCGQLLISYLLAGAVLGGLKIGRPAQAAAA